jgi:hypothetical protein
MRRNTILVARINGSMLLVFGMLWGVAQFTAIDEPLWKQFLMAFCMWGVGAAGGAMAWWGFRKPLPPKARKST